MLRFALFGMDSFGDDVRSGDFPEELIMCLLISRCLKYRLNRLYGVTIMLDSALLKSIS